MGRHTALAEDDGAICRFARRLHDDLGFDHVLLYGAFKRDFAMTIYEYKLILVSRSFEGVDLLDRPVDLHDVYYDLGGNGALSFICLTPDEFERAKHRITLVREVLPEAIDLLADVPTAP